MTDGSDFAATSEWVLPLPPTVSLAVADGQGISRKRFAVGRVFCAGRNYWWPDAAAADKADPAPPTFFMKPADAIMAATGTLPYPSETTDFCHEIELVAAIGTGGFNIPRNQALQHIWGYAVGLDMTRRDVQAQAKKQGMPWEGAKAFDHSAPLTPLIPVADCGHPARGAIWLSVNGACKQRADLADQIWQIADLIHFISRSIMLKPGDLIMTGTPAGVSPLLPGDVVTAGIDGLAEICMTIAQPVQTRDAQPARNGPAQAA